MGSLGNDRLSQRKHHRYPIIAEPVVCRSPSRLALDETAVKQTTQVIGQVRRTQASNHPQAHDRLRAITESFEDGEARWISKAAKEFGLQPQHLSTIRNHRCPSRNISVNAEV
jgi:hypothetical protein